MNITVIKSWIDFTAKLCHWLSTFCFVIAACSFLSAIFLTDMWWSVIDASLEHVPPDANPTSVILIPFLPVLFAGTAAVVLFGLGILLRILCKSGKIFDLAAWINICSMSLPVFAVLLFLTLGLRQ